MKSLYICIQFLYNDNEDIFGTNLTNYAMMIIEVYRDEINSIGRMSHYVHY